MALTPQLVSEIVRHRLGEPDSSRAARFEFLVPEALKLTGRKIAANTNLRQLLTTDPLATTAVLAADFSISLPALYASDQILLEYLDYGQIYLENEKYPLQMMDRQRSQLPQYLGNYYRYYYVEGDKLFVKDGIAGDTVSFAVSYYPATLADLPDSEEVEALFLSKLVELVVSQDAAEDGER